MTPEIRYLVSYACPNCRRLLEARSTGWDGWLRCPVCNCPSLPPEIMLDGGEARRRAAAQQAFDDSVLIIAESPETPFERDSSATVDLGRPSHTTPARLIFTTGLALSLFLVLVAYLDDRMGRMAVFGLLSIGFFMLLVRSPRTRVAPREPSDF
jgi:hypothetical protein